LRLSSFVLSRGAHIVVVQAQQCCSPTDHWDKKEQAMADRPATTFLRLAIRRAARGTGSSRAFLMGRTAVQAIPDLGSILPSIPWVLVDELALRAYIPERMTLDVDILIHKRDSATARQLFI